MNIEYFWVGEYSQIKRCVVVLTQTVAVADVGQNILAANVRSAVNPTFDAGENAFLFPHDAGPTASRVWNQCVILLQVGRIREIYIH